MLTRKPPTRDREAERADRLRVLMTPATGVQRGVIRRADAPVQAPVRKVTPKTPGRKQQAIRDSARGEACRMRLIGCPSDPAMTIWSHNRHAYAGKGGAIKAIDLNGALACTYCDAVYDGQRPRPAGMTEQDVELAWFRAHAESLVVLKQKGLV